LGEFPFRRGLGHGGFARAEDAGRIWTLWRRGYRRAPAGESVKVQDFDGKVLPLSAILSRGGEGILADGTRLPVSWNLYS